MSVFLDTNVLIYAVLDDAPDLHRQAIALDLLDRDDCVLSVQVLNEFVTQSTRPTRDVRLPFDVAMEHVRVWRRFPIQDLTLDVFDNAVSMMKRGKFSWWDALIVAAARAQGCDILYSEDMQDGRIIDRLRIVNPFV